ncbi:heterokaryon incompatibility protein-domain-containing protein [Camillea tinctor]|nr:heterokaryon incompatibility protein-domain-containing protein [Camillea tinctor]
MSFMQEVLANKLFTQLDYLYRAFVYAAGAEVNGPPPEPDARPTQKELELQCIIPRVLDIVQQARFIVSDSNIFQEGARSELRSELRTYLNEVLRALNHDISKFHSALLQHQPIPLQVNGYDKYPELMKVIEETEKILLQCRPPEPFNLPPLPSGSGPTPQHHVNYDYSDMPLPTRSSIRLISIKPTQSKDINVTLRTVDLHDNPRYTTLSYTWGPPLNVFLTDEERRRTQSQLDDPQLQTTVPITCNRSPLRVTENLYRFLCRWRDGSIHASFDTKSREEREIWIDAICINQNDFYEKNVQVAKMGEIYSKSQGAYIWLGEEDGFSRIAIPLIRQLARFQGDWNSLRELGPSGAERELLDRGLPSIWSWDFICLFAFFRRAWFRRAWICQEVAFPPELSIFCGDVNISDWRIMTSAAMYLSLTSLVIFIDKTASTEIRGLELAESVSRTIETPFDFSPSEVNPSHQKLFCSDAGGTHLGSGMAILHLDNLRKADDSKRPVNGPVVVIEPASPHEQVIELFKTSRIMKATNPRDKVYAFLDLAKRPCYNTTKPHPGRRELEPKYQLRVEDVYLEASWYLLLTEQNLGLLSSSEEYSGVKKHMPSWVVDWEAPNVTGSFITPLHEPDWRASGDSTWEVPESKLYQSSLPVRGWKISTISAAVQGAFCPSKAALVAADTPEIYQWASDTQSRVEALWRTLVADHVDRQNPALPHCEQIFRREWAWQLEDARRKCEEGSTSASQDAKETLQRFQHAEDKLHICPEESTDTERPFPTNELSFMARYERTNFRRTVFRTDANYLGNGPRQLKVGDQVWILAGAKVPFILRPQACGGYQLVGEAYVHGVMRGEVLDRPGVGSEEIELV